MDQQGEDFPGGPPPGRNNNNVRGGSGFSNNNIFPPGLRAIDPQYAAALDFEELRIRHQLEVQQDIELRRRLMEEQQHQLLSELEYRNKIQQLQELQELQAQQQQQQGLSQLLAQNPHLMELQQQQQHQQQQQYQSGRDNSLLTSIRNDFLLQRHQLMLQDQMQQQMQEQMSRDSQQHEQEELLAMIRASGHLRGMMPPDVASLRHEETIAQQPSSEQSPPQPKPPSVESTPVQLEHIINSSHRQRADSTPVHQDRAHAQVDVVSSSKKRDLSESMKINGKGAPQDPPIMLPKKMRSATESPQIKPNPSKDESTEDKATRNKELDEKVAKLLESQKLSTTKQKEKTSTEKKPRKKKPKAEEPPVKKGGKKKKAPAALSEDQDASKQDSTDDGSTLLDHEQSVIDFLGSRGKKNGKSKKSQLNGADQARGKKKGKGVKEMKERDDVEAVDIILHFKRFDVSADEVVKAKTWSNQNQSLTTTYPVVSPEGTPFISPGLNFNLPALPNEPELTDLALAMGPLLAKQPSAADATVATNEMSSNNGSSESAGVNGHDKKGDLRNISFQKHIFKPKKAGKGQDDWWPSNSCIRKERRKRGDPQDEEDTDEEDDATGDSRQAISFVKAGVEATRERLATSVEPGVLEKLPHCKLYDDYCKEKKNVGSALKFCCQTTETFPFEVMVCCSVCSTWRHAQCGGHYKRYTADSVDPSNILFEPICDRCYLEKQFVEDNPVAATRIERQRIEHLRRCNAASAVMRQVAFGKHSGQYKWPLGSVSISHISGHTRSVQARHEKAEKQWSEMVARLGNAQELRPRERQRVRTRELERLLVSVEDAEGAMDRHNMMLFLQNDTSKFHPAGFDLPRRNIFDPEEDPVYVPVHHGSTKPMKGLVDGDSDSSHSSNVEHAFSMTDINKPMPTSQVGVKELTANTDYDAGKIIGNGPDKDDEPSAVEKCHVCAGQACNQKPRFDSIFCSDSCGVSTLETDLLRTLQYASKLHPTVLR